MLSLWLSGISVVLTLCFVVSNHLFSYWKRRGIPSVKAIPPVGCLLPVLRQKLSIAAVLRDIHLNNNEPIVGIYCLYRPVLLVRDPELVKRVLITDFDYFPERGFPYDEKNDPIAAHLFGMPGAKWRPLRARFSPTFSSGKLKNMFPTIVEKSILLREHLHELSDTSKQVQMKDLFGYSIVSILATVFFGIEVNALDDPDHYFVQMGKIFFDVETVRSKVVNAAMFCFPELFDKFGLQVLPSKVSKYALDLVQSVMKLRKSDATLYRNDFIQTLIELMQEPSASGNNNALEMDKNEEKLTLEVCTAQAYLFYAAGYETSASTASFCLYELAKSPEWMDRVYSEIDDLMKRCNGKILYEDLVELKNLDMCLKETLRKYPAVPLLNRLCVKDYKIPGTEHVVEKGTPIIISNYGLQMDEKFFPNPQVFDPNRFDGDSDADDLPYYPLGGGPRYCIGARLGMIMVQVQLIYLIHAFKFTSIDPEIRFNPQSIVLTDLNRINLTVEKRKT